MFDPIAARATYEPSRDFAHGRLASEDGDGRVGADIEEAGPSRKRSRGTGSEGPRWKDVTGLARRGEKGYGTMGFSEALPILGELVSDVEFLKELKKVSWVSRLELVAEPRR